MNNIWRWLLIVVSILGLIPSCSGLVTLYKHGEVETFLGTLAVKNFTGGQKFLLTLMFLILIAGFIAAIIYAFTGERFRGKRASNNEYGYVEISAGAIENIALNSAKAAQAGIKTAKAKVSTEKEDAVSVFLEVVLYSDVEIPQQMNKIQERVKKDIEKYTGLAVESVVINVKRVELLSSVVER